MNDDIEANAAMRRPIPERPANLTFVRMEMSEPRYFVDDRIGCVAVRDRTLTDPEYQGLHPDTEGVVQFWDKARVPRMCDHCGQSLPNDWDAGVDQIAEAQALCDRMNSEHRGTQ